MRAPFLYSYPCDAVRRVAQVVFQLLPLNWQMPVRQKQSQMCHIFFSFFAESYLGNVLIYLSDAFKHIVFYIFSVLIVALSKRVTIFYVVHHYRSQILHCAVFSSLRSSVYNTSPFSKLFPSQLLYVSLNVTSPRQPSLIPQSRF